jgi:glycine/D-amino acid oxidase-like deaminating enzyme
MKEDAQNVDVVIVGGGLAGLWCAFCLSKEERRVILIEKDKLGEGATKYTTAFITEAIDTDLPELISLYGEDGAKEVWLSGEEAINQIEKVVKEEKIECDFMRCPAFVYASEEKQLEEIEKEVKNAEDLGFNMEMGGRDIGFKNYGYAVLQNQAKYNAQKFLTSLAEIARENGVTILENTECKEINEENDKLKVITTNNKEIISNNVVVATYDPFNHPKEVMLKKGFYKSYVLTAEIPKGLLEEALYFDNSNPYFYFRIDKNDDKTDLITIGGADHKRIVPMLKEESLNVVESHLKTILPNVKYKIKDKWEGPILEPSDGIALIGEYKPHQYIASAFSGNGMTYSAISGKIITDLILGRKNKWEIYDPKRSRDVERYAKKGKEYVEELGGRISQSLKKKKK